MSSTADTTDLHGIRCKIVSVLHQNQSFPAEDERMSFTSAPRSMYCSVLSPYTLQCSLRRKYRFKLSRLTGQEQCPAWLHPPTLPPTCSSARQWMSAIHLSEHVSKTNCEGNIFSEHLANNCERNSEGVEENFLWTSCQTFCGGNFLSEHKKRTLVWIWLFFHSGLTMLRTLRQPSCKLKFKWIWFLNRINYL